MNKVINVLIELASDASIKNSNDVLSALSKAELTTQQLTAMLNLDKDALKQATPNLPEIKCFPLVLPTDQEELINIKSLVNF